MAEDGREEARRSGELTLWEDAQALIFAACDALEPREVEEVPLEDALGRTLVEDQHALRTMPPWDNSAMDGYAVRACDVATPPTRLRILEEVSAGMLPEQTVTAGTCARIMTGAPLPAGADAVVMQERAHRAGAAGTLGEVDILEAARPRQNVRDRGEDAREGECLLRARTGLGIPELALLWGQGLERIRVPRRPRVGILSTGNELRPAGSSTGRGGIIDTNGPALALAVARAGGIPERLGIAKDSVESVLKRLGEFNRFDVLITSAGVSVGDHDPVKAALEQAGMRTVFWRAAIKPGKPIAFGTLETKLVFALPGNPASSLVTFELFVRPALRRMLGHLGSSMTPLSAKLAAPLRKPPGLDQFVRVEAEWRGDGLWARPLPSQTSGAVRSTMLATHLLHFPRVATELEVGDTIRMLAVSWVA